jgi:membrane fusion protein, heavy metal efflux system
MIDFSRQSMIGHSNKLCALLFMLSVSCGPSTKPSVIASQAEDESPEPVAITVFTDQVELFMEYPRLVPGRSARFLAHLTVLSTGEPVRSGRIRLELSHGIEPTIVFEAPRPTRDGLFVPVGVIDRPGEYQAKIVVQSDQVLETIFLPTIVVHPDLASALAAAESEAEQEPVNAVPFLLESQWKIGLLMQKVERRSLIQRLQAPGEVEAPHHAMAVVSAPLGGRLLPPEQGRLPRIGDRVEKGQILALLEPPLTTSDSAQLAANHTYRDTLELGFMIREFDVKAKALEIQQALLQSKARLAFAEQALARIEKLRLKDLGTIAELEAARRDVEIAEQEFQGSKALKESFLQAEKRLSILQARNAATHKTTRPEGIARHALVAPISGEIVAANHVEGEYVESLGELYRLLDLNQVWIAVHISEFDLARVGDAPDALLEFAAYPDQTFDVLGEMNGRIVNVGRVVDPESRTITLRYEVSNSPARLRAGMFADVYLETGQAINAVVVPEVAIVMDNGRPVVFVLLDGETFQKRELELGIRDGGLVEVRSGLEAGERLVTKGAYLVKLASASPASFGEGHAH